MVLTSRRHVSRAANKIYRLGWVTSASQARPSENILAFKEALRKFGYIEGQDVIFDVQSFEGNLNKLPGVVAGIVAQKPDVIVGSTNAVIGVLQQTGTTIPVVMTFVTDPIQFGLVVSLRQPGGNITGLTDMRADIVGKYMELISFIAPGATQIGVLTTNYASQLARVETIRAAAKISGMVVRAELVLTPKELANAFSSLAKYKLMAVIVLGGLPFGVLRKELAALATKFRMCTLSPTRNYVEAGGLLRYGPNSTQQFELAAGYVDKIFKSAKPGNLPIQQPAKFESIINRKMANLLGITLSQELLLLADEVVQ